jgi:peptidoglycan hydrolase CwlO-like protein
MKKIVLAISYALMLSFVVIPHILPAQALTVEELQKEIEKKRLEKERIEEEIKKLEAQIQEVNKQANLIPHKKNSKMI